MPLLRMSLRGWILLTRAVSAVGLALYGAATLLEPEGTPRAALLDSWAYCGLMVAATVILASRALLVPRGRAAWLCFTAGAASWTFGEVWYSATHPETYPSAADAGWLAFYPCAYAGMVLLLRPRARGIGGMLWLDGLTASVAAASVGAAVLVQLVLESTGGPLAAVATNLAYPLGDLLLLSAVFGVFSLARWRPGRCWLLLGLGLLATAIADGVYLFRVAEGSYVEGTWLDIMWPAALLLLATAAWADERGGLELNVEGRPLLAVPAASAVAAIAILVYDHFRPVNLLALGLASSTLLLVVARLGATFRENARLLALTRQDATTDDLTGLGNRRKLIADLERRLRGEGAGPALLMLFDLDGFKRYNDTFGHPAGDALLARLGAKLAEVAHGRGAAYRLGGDEFCLVATAEPAEVEALIDHAAAALSEHGEGFKVSSSFGAVLLPEEAGAVGEALHLADERLYAHKQSRQRSADRAVQVLLDALSEREPEIPGHLEQLVSLALEVGAALELDAAERERLRRAAQLHDVGKLAVPDEILAKDGALEEHEWALVRQHPLVGERLLRASPALRDVARIVRSTHERWDGRGYPDGLAGEEIPLAARIVAACEAFCAMTAERPYRRALAPREALAELERLAGTQFDPAVVRALVSCVRRRLSTGAASESSRAPAGEPTQSL